MINSKNVKITIYISLLLCLTISAQTTDSIKMYWLDPVEIKATGMSWEKNQFPFERDNVAAVIQKNGFSFIRKGNFFAHDLYADGLKRGDISLVIDGERYPNACPNRMDSPVTRVNPLEIANINLVKTSSSHFSGLGGMVSFEREIPVQPVEIKGGFSNYFDKTEGYDAAVSINAYNNRLTGRYTRGYAYESASGKTFKELYNYKENYSYNLKEVSLHGKISDFQYGAGYSTTEDILFPYLMMDEITNDLINAFISYKGHKIYFNHTDHLMTNELRNSTMPMQTDAQNTTIGLSSDFYEIYYRNWNADNEIKTQMSTIKNHLMPDLNQVSAGLNKNMKYDEINISGHVGIVHTYIDDKNVIEKFNQLYSDANNKTTYFKFGIGVNYSKLLSDNIWGSVLAEISSEPPAVEYLYINVKRAMNKPTWLGNPNLKAPVRSTLRTSIQLYDINLELFGSYISNYVNLAKVAAGENKYMTYKNITGVFGGFNITGKIEMIDFNASYTIAENKTDKTPMPEIIPFTAGIKFNAPSVFNMNSYVGLTYSDAQVRVDKSLNETPSRSWYKIDASASYTIYDITLSLTIENLTNQLYSQHLSYLRDPFASGSQVFDPGRTIRLSVMFDKIF